MYSREALNTIKAPFWRLWLAKMLGRRWTGRDDYFEVSGYLWRGKTYLTDFTERTVR